MALVIRGKSTCPLCGSVLADGDELWATTHFIADRNDPLWRFSDAAMHLRCFEAWEHHDEFAAKYEAFKTAWEQRRANRPGT